MVALVVNRIGEHEVRARTADKYVDATALCQAADKRWNDYATLDRTKGFLKALEQKTGLDCKILVQAKRGREGGTWIHPYVAINFAQWVSPEFEVAVSIWVTELLASGRVDLGPPAPGGEPPRSLESLMAEQQEQIAALSAAVQRAAAEAAKDAIQRLLADQGTGPKLTGPFWTVAAWLEENMPHWNTTAAQRHAIGQDAKRRVMRACPGEQVGYFNRDLAFQAHQEYYLSKAAQNAFKRAQREGKAQTFGLFANDETGAGNKAA